ncbi:hypothetical protein WN55_10839 [Dufourea novaeangliae]|uniref:Uncharacterized protein n=1 Tax=Dufourea novaeangliae TaxID=178035 RepID=A0A154P9K8_DUFNO|nr:hypothetical protein WN55_10839 [Dufourea novaeangliae]
MLSQFNSSNSSSERKKSCHRIKNKLERHRSEIYYYLKGNEYLFDRLRIIPNGGKGISWIYAMRRKHAATFIFKRECLSDEPARNDLQVLFTKPSENALNLED